MAFKLNTFSIDDTQKKASIAINDEKGTFMNFIFQIDIQENESIEEIKRRALGLLSGLVNSAVDDVIKNIPLHGENPHSA